MRDVTLTTPT